MEKIPTPVIIGGGVLAAFLLLRGAMGSGSGVSTLGAGPASNTDLASIDAKAQGFATVVNDLTSLAIHNADVTGGIQLEQIRGANTLAIANAEVNGQVQQAEFQANTVRQASSDSLAAARTAQRGETTRSLISGLLNAGTMLFHAFGG